MTLITVNLRRSFGNPPRRRVALMLITAATVPVIAAAVALGWWRIALLVIAALQAALVIVLLDARSRIGIVSGGLPAFASHAREVTGMVESIVARAGRLETNALKAVGSDHKPVAPVLQEAIATIRDTRFDGGFREQTRQPTKASRALQSYGDIWIDGKLANRGERDCEPRYQAIRKYVTEESSVLDVGANTGYFGIRLLEEFGGRATLVDDCPILPKVVEQQNQAVLGAIRTIPRRLSVPELWALPRHDVVLALSVLHHFAEWRDALEALRACRQWLICEVPHPDETWMRHAKGRHELRELHETVSSLGTPICESPRTGRDGSEWTRTTYAVPGTLRTYKGEVFSGSGNNRRSLDEYADESLTKALGYVPYYGSLNLRVGQYSLGEPHVRWEREIGKRRRSYVAWRAWIEDVHGHAVIPTTKAHWVHADALEVWAPVKLRDRFNLKDGDTIGMDVAS